MVNRKKFFLILIIGLCSAINLSKTNAASGAFDLDACISKAYGNQSMINACSNCYTGRTGRLGTIWANNSEFGGSVDRHESIIDVTSASDLSAVQFKIYGNYLQCQNETRSDTFYGYYVTPLVSDPGIPYGTITADTKSYYAEDGKHLNTSVVELYTPISMSGTTINRGRGARPYDFSTGYEGLKATINVYKALESADYDSSAGGYHVEFYLYRCPNQNAYCNLQGNNVYGVDVVEVFIRSGGEISSDCDPTDPTCPNDDNCDPTTDCCPGEKGYPDCDEECGDDCDDTCPLPSSLTSSASSGWNDGEDGGRSSVASGVRNLSTSKSWKSTVYAKPGNKIEFMHCFYSGAQEATETSDCDDGEECSVGDDVSVDNGNSWSISRLSAPSLDISGASESYSNNNAVHNISKSGTVGWEDVGDSYSQSASVGSGTYSISVGEDTHDCTYTGPCGPADPETGEPTEGECYAGSHVFRDAGEPYTDSNNDDSAEVVVPYNFINHPDIQINTSTLYAGETASITATVDVGTRKNNHEDINSTYATRVDDVKIRVIAYSSESDNYNDGGESSGDLCSRYDYLDCTVVNKNNDPNHLFDGLTLNEDGDLDGSIDTVLEGATYNVYDIKAGQYFCVALAVYPANSGSDTNTSTDGNGMWAVSDSACKTVYKKPSFQVWGGSLYTGSSDVRIAYKNNLSGYFSYRPVDRSNNIVFGPWAEYSVVYGKEQGNATTTAIASGATGGYTENNNGTLKFNPGGIKEPATSSNYCKRSPLSIANVNCASNKIAKSGITASSAMLNSIDGIFIDGHSFKKVANNADLSNSSSYNEDNRVRYTEASSSTLKISASSNLPVSTTHIIHSTGTINITSNLTYENTVLTSITQMPQYIIYAKNINISCDVSRIDGWLIAKDGAIDTCSDGGDNSSQKRSRQLVVNGPVVAKTLTLGRTYGASTGKNSGVPAEIFNMTPITNLWSEAGATNTPTLYSQYIKELAPRY